MHSDQTSQNRSLSPSENKLTTIRDLTHEQIADLMAEFKQPAFRVKQIEDWIWNKHVENFDQMTNLPASLREKLASHFSIALSSEIARQVSSDGCRKYLLQFSDGNSVECVGIPSKNRLSVCVSTQAGCGMKCAFCATGKSGLSRSLKAEEIYDQVIHAQNDFGTRVSSVVFMGQGEPFANYDETLKALRMLNKSETLGIGARHLTVSTCGVVPMIHKFAKEPEQFTLAISLHSAVQKTRDALMPGVKKWSLLRLWDAMQAYVDLTGRRPTYEYALIAGVNDTEEELAALRDFTSGTLAHVNLIMLNHVSGSPFEPSSEARAQHFIQTLNAAGVDATLRDSRGSDIDAACGQLKQNYSSN